MSDRLNRIYTRTGDKGTTALANGNRVPKTHPRIEALGTVDELNSLLGLLIAELSADHALLPLLRPLQHDLFDLGGELAVADETYQVITEDVVTVLEVSLDRLNDTLPPLKEFILPGGNRAAATCQLTRSICRRAERNMIELGHNEYINPQGAAYLNRLSDLLFVVARILARESGEEILWKPRAART
ncbi:MAG: cob(I)yrinic acid a,c-diamide adenosyltransferase [Pontibacterium sp.]